ncbi:hypothetical protein EV127DRAFT_421761 [Xylaria flabelliformis]|nr:hypothetical protein EV127DRAFT_421761 [Xylaria flabelliformis]
MTRRFFLKRVWVLFASAVTVRTPMKRALFCVPIRTTSLASTTAVSMALAAVLPYHTCPPGCVCERGSEQDLQRRCRIAHRQTEQGYDMYLTFDGLDNRVQVDHKSTGRSRFAPRRINVR